MNTKSNKMDLNLLWKGALFGVANIIPGVSGGTIAVITGVYDDFMDAISHFIKQWKFLLVYLGGAMLGILLGSFTLEALFENWPGPTLFCFMGFILGGIPLLWKRSDLKGKIKPSWIMGFVISFTLVIAMKFLLNPSESTAITQWTPQIAVIIFCAGAAAASAMVIPGVSGSFLLLLIGMYTTFVGAVTHMNFPILITAAAGVVVGILFTAKIMGVLLAKFHHGTYAVIMGLVLGSLIALWPGIPRGWMIPVSAAALLFGLWGGYKLGDRE
ncbi:MAG: DUF368 domain-containing protein [Spirochaetaceae bacterium]|jgi:putative membrane protein|nr:DUF368 domain-containing protein [Spirochaetaceae bacterium]